MKFYEFTMGAHPDKKVEPKILIYDKLHVFIIDFKKEYNVIKAKVIEYFEKASIVLTEQEKSNIEVADFGLNDLNNTECGKSC